MSAIITEDRLNTYTNGLKSVLNNMGSTVGNKLDAIQTIVEAIQDNYVTETYLDNALSGIGGASGEVVTVTLTGDLLPAIPTAAISSGDGIFATVQNGGSVTIPIGVTYTVTALDANGDPITETAETFTSSVLTRNVTITYDSLVDLGLTSGTKWRKFNIGASTPSEVGLYFSWGDITGHEGGTYDFSQGNYNNKVSGNGSALPASFTSGDANYDAARANLGGSWRMPTLTEQNELINSCTWTWTTLNGVNGYNVEGPNGKSIFLPVSGYYDGSSLSDSSSGYYWSTTWYSSSGSCYLYFRSNNKLANYSYRYFGMVVRPVQ